MLPLLVMPFCYILKNNLHDLTWTRKRIDYFICQVIRYLVVTFIINLKKQISISTKLKILNLILRSLAANHVIYFCLKKEVKQESIPEFFYVN